MDRRTMLAGSVAVPATLFAPKLAMAQEALTIGIGTQDTTTNTVTTGVVIRRLGLLEKHLPRTGRYANARYQLDWQNFTSGPPVTNGMMANKLHFGAMGDFPLVVNGFTFQSNPESRSALVSVAAYNMAGSGNGIVVHKDSNFFSIDDLRGRTLSVPFGSAAHGMVLKAMQDRGWAPNAISLVSQTPEVGSTNLQERKIDAHANFVPFPELLQFRGFARKVFDGVETNAPTWHGVVVRTDFAERHPEIVVAYVKAIIEANAWVRANPREASEQIAQWTAIPREVVYMFLGPGGIMTLDPTIKPQLVADAAEDAKVLQNLGRMREFDVTRWVDDRYVRRAFSEMGLDYERQRASVDNYGIEGQDALTREPITDQRKTGQIWFEADGILSYASTENTLRALAQAQGAGRRHSVAYVVDTQRGIKLFADQAYYSVGRRGADFTAVPFMLRREAEAYAQANQGRVASLDDAVRAAVGG